MLEAPKRLKAIGIKTMPYPGFPTDLQPVFGAMLVAAKGTSIIEENIFESRYKYTNELQKMGAKIQIEGKMAQIKGVRKLHASILEALDLRGRCSFSISSFNCKEWNN